MIYISKLIILCKLEWTLCFLKGLREVLDYTKKRPKHNLNC